MNFFDSSKSIIENIYFLSGPILAILGVTGVIQLFFAKKALITNSKREAANLAGNQVEIYSNKIIPYLTDLYAHKKENNIEDVVIEIGEFNQEYLIQILGRDKCIQLSKKRRILAVPFLRVMNSLEAFSTYFIKRVADEEIAYSAVGKSFCHVVERMYFDISSCCRKDDPRFSNTIALYNIWKERIKKEKLTREKISIIEKLNDIKDDRINPIGTI